MRTWWLSIARRSRLLAGLSLLVLATFGLLAAMPSGSLDDLAAVPFRTECGYLKILPWRNLDPHMVIPRPFPSRPSAMPEPSPSQHEVGIGTPGSTSGSIPEPGAARASYPPNCHPMPKIVPIAPAAP
ncbi:hypothetical protein [Nitrolancea hollandica]|uniref:Uncharacterized protein n=1 Tax=Nitrolancea hollandica Lb TaxID=1129897 RepID=I4EMS1_9BACT|nr:hypothetical protein [Nitrolancea hollandica]CCF85984.1 exported hypothetical protein [Nitrolancea hollandica Lb]